MIFIAGPGHGGPAVVANTWLEGSYSELYSDISQDEEGMRRLFRQFSFPGGIPSHAAPETPGSIHEGGELGYALFHAYGAVFDNPDLIACCVVGDGEAETGPLATSWHSNKFLNPRTDGAVLPILHLNGYKIASPAILARIGHAELESLLVGYGYWPYFVEGDDPEAMHRLMAEAVDTAIAEIREIQLKSRTARRGGASALADDRAALAQGLDRAEGSGWQENRGLLAFAPGAVQRNGEAGARAVAGAAGCSPTGPRNCSMPTAGSCPNWRHLAPGGGRRMGANPHANGGALLRDLRLPDFRDYAVAVRDARRDDGRVHAGDGDLPARRDAEESGQLPRLRPGRDHLQSSRRVVRSDQPHLDGRALRLRRPSRRRWPGDGDPLRTRLPGLARRLSADRPARAVFLLRGLHPHRRFDVQPARQMAQGVRRDSLAPPHRLAQHPAHLARLAPGQQRLLASGSRLHRSRGEQEGRHHPRLSAAGCQHPAGGRPTNA